MNTTKAKKFLHLKFYGLSSVCRVLIPEHLTSLLLTAKTPKEIELQFPTLEPQLVALGDELDEF